MKFSRIRWIILLRPTLLAKRINKLMTKHLLNYIPKIDYRR